MVPWHNRVWLIDCFESLFGPWHTLVKLKFIANPDPSETPGQPIGSWLQLDSGG